jgi:hypothetical protein
MAAEGVVVTPHPTPGGENPAVFTSFLFFVDHSERLPFLSSQDGVRRDRFGSARDFDETALLPMALSK